MLVPGDVVTAKLTVQLGLVPADTVRWVMRLADEDPDTGCDLISHLAEKNYLDEVRVKRVRRYAAMFDHVRHEAVYLREVEKREPRLSSEEIAEVIARVEKDSYRRRLGHVLVELGHLPPEQAVAFDNVTRERIWREDLRVLRRYRKEKYAGVARPLIPANLIETRVFKVSSLFRSPRTVRFVKEALDRLRNDEIARPLLEFLPPDEDDFDPEPVAPPTQAAIEPAPPTQGEEAFADEDVIEKQRMDTARFRRPTAPVRELSFADRKRIAHYSIIEVLGQGGMGAVYLGQEEGMGAMVAVKVMRAEKAAPDDVARFIREAQICSMLSHPNVVHLMDKGKTEDGLDYMAIPFFVGRDMKAVLEEQSPMDPTLAFNYIEQTLAGLESIHQKGIVHRDLKPENIFVLAGGEEIKIVDFGIARLLDHDKPAEDRLYETKAGVISGSPAYVAPETVSGGRLDARTDIYSLGIMLYKMLTGRLPLFAETPVEYLREHLIGVPLTLFQGKKDSFWCDEIEQLMASMLAKEPDDRPPSCQAILDLLNGGLRERTLEALANPPAAEPEAKKGLTGMFNTFFKMLGD